MFCVTSHYFCIPIPCFCSSPSFEGKLIVHFTISREKSTSAHVIINTPSYKKNQHQLFLNFSTPYNMVTALTTAPNQDDHCQKDHRKGPSVNCPEGFLTANKTHTMLTFQLGSRVLHQMKGISTTLPFIHKSFSSLK